MTTIKASQMTEGEVLVQGTLDPMEAMKIAFEDWTNIYRLEESMYCVGRWHEGDLYEENEITPETVRNFGDYLFDMLARARPGLYRKVPTRDEDYVWMLWPVDKPGRGAFPAVEFP